MVDSQPWPKRPTLRMVAAEAGVSTATVSYVVSGRTGRASGVSEGTAARVRQAADRLRYRPNPAAREMRTGRSKLVLLSLTMLADPWSQAVAEAVNAAMTPSGTSTLVIADSDWFPVLERQPCDVAFVDAAPDTAKTRRHLDRLVDRGTRLIVFSEALEPNGFDVIRSPSVPACTEAVAHLLDNHTRIGCLTSSRTARRLSRFGAYTDGLAAAGLTLRDDWVEEFDSTPTSAYAAAVRLLSLPDRPSAIYVTTDFAAISAIYAAHRLRLQVPEDLAVIGVGNTLEGQHLSPSLSSVGPTDFFARLAEIIRTRAVGEDQSPGRVHDFAWSLFARESTATMDVVTPAPANSQPSQPQTGTLQ